MRGLAPHGQGDGGGERVSGLHHDARQCAHRQRGVPHAAGRRGATGGHRQGAQARPQPAQGALRARGSGGARHAAQHPELSVADPGRALPSRAAHGAVREGGAARTQGGQGRVRLRGRQAGAARQRVLVGDGGTMSTATQVRPGKLFIGGEWQDSASGKTFEVENPALGETLTTCAEAGPEDVGRAVHAAREAFDNEAGPWRKMSPREREALLRKVADGIQKRADEFATLETLNNGKPLFESKIDVSESISVFQYFAGWPSKMTSEVLPLSAGPFHAYTLREPLGVVGSIVPWNFPLNMATWHVAPALATGNAVVLKPAQQTPLTALLLAEVMAAAGGPAGAFNVVPGPGSAAGAALVQHPGVDKISFTGSTEVGKWIAREAAGTVKKISLELGGKSPNVIFADADLDAAVRGAIAGIFYGKGEVCAAGSRLLVERSVHDAVVEKVVEQAKKRVPGDPFDPKTRLGAVVSSAQQKAVLGYIEKGKAEGARLRCGGKAATVNGKGHYVEATVFDQVRPEM